MKIILFACVEKNIGDDLFIYTVCNRYKDTQFLITNSAEYGDLKKIDNLRFSKLLNYWDRFSDNTCNSNVKNIFKKFILTFLKLLIGRNNTSIYIVGNAFKNMNYTGKKQTYWLKSRLKLSKNFYLLSTNFGPYNDDRWKQDCGELFNNMTDVCFRDKYSSYLFKDLKNVRYAPDAVLSMNVSCNSCEKNTVIISMIDCALEIRGEKINKIHEIYEKRLAEITDMFAKKGLAIVLLTSNNDQDFPAAKRIFDQSNYKDQIQIFKYQGNFLDVFSLYQNAKYCIATRLHTIILAWKFQIPVIPIIYDINFEDLTIDLFSIEKLDIKNIEISLNNYSFNKDNIESASNYQFEMLDQLLCNNKEKK